MEAESLVSTSCGRSTLSCAVDCPAPIRAACRRVATMAISTLNRLAATRNGRGRAASDGFAKTDTPSSVPQRQSEPLGPLTILELPRFVYRSPARKLIDCNMHPVMLLALHNEIVLEACCVWLIATRLCYHIDQHIPDTRLRNGRNCPRNNFSSSLHSLIVLRGRR